MRFVNDIDFGLQVYRSKFCLIQQRPHLVHARIGSSVHFYDIDTVLCAQPARFALSAGFAVFRIKAVDGLGEDPCSACLAYSSRTAEKIGMRNTPAADLISEYTRNMLLPYHFRKAAGSVFSV